MLLSAAALLGRASAQLVEADWVGQAEQAVDRVRKTDVRVIVMDEVGRPQIGATVHIRQVRSAFAWGVAVPPEQLHRLGGDEVVWRCFNAVSLEPLTRWDRLQAAPDSPLDLAPVLEVAGRARRQGLTVRWGAMVAADPAANPAWLDVLPPRDLAGALEAYVDAVAGAAGPDVQAFDLYLHTLSHQFPNDRLGPAMLRRLYERATAAAPGTRLAVRFGDVLVGPRVRQLAKVVPQLREDFVPFDEVAIEQVVLNKVNRAPLQRSLEAVRQLGYDAVLVNLEVGGSSPAGAALNLEMLLRTVFAEPAVTGVYLSGITPEQVAAPEAALLDEQGKPTLAGESLDALVARQWRTDLTTTTDELGNALVRVFTGSLTFEATLPDGRAARTTAWIDASPEARIIVLQPLVGP